MVVRNRADKLKESFAVAFAPHRLRHEAIVSTVTIIGAVPPYRFTRNALDIAGCQAMLPRGRDPAQEALQACPGIRGNFQHYGRPHGRDTGSEK